MRSKLEESVSSAAEDAQMQINNHSMTNNKLEKLIAGLKENFEATKHGAQTQIVRMLTLKGTDDHQLFSFLFLVFCVMQFNFVFQKDTFSDSILGFIV